MFQDNKSSILLEPNGRKSAGKRNLHINIHYFFSTDHVRKENMEITHCPTEGMFGGYMTKPLQGEKFRESKKMILGM